MTDDAAPQAESEPRTGVLRWWHDYGPMTTVGASTVVALAGIVVGAVIAIQSTERSIRAENIRQVESLREQREVEARELRRLAYEAFSLAADRYATTQSLRATCTPGTDLPAAGGAACGVSLGTLQNARFEFQDALNSIYTLGSPEALDAMRAVAAALPESMVGTAGAPIEGPVDEQMYGAALHAFMEAMHCDTSPTPRPECSE